jgi:flagellar basal body-associated protein FliL
LFKVAEVKEKMADNDDKKEKENAKVEKNGQPQQTGTNKITILTWVIMAAAVALLAGSGFVLGRLFAGSSSPEATEFAQKDEPAKVENLKMDDSSTGSQNIWYYDLEPVVANLDEPGVTRYVRATITMEISTDLEKSKGEKIIEEKRPRLRNWLAIYLASLTLDDARGDRNLKRIQSQILDAFNETLFPDAKPQIKRILFKEGFAIQ